MRNSTFVPRVSRLPFLAVALILSAGCAGRMPTPDTVARDVSPAPAAMPAIAPALSVFDIQDFWYSQHATAARLASLSGGLLVVGFVDDACSTSCTETLASMRTIERETDVGVHFIVVSRVTENGTPAKLAAFAKTKHLSANRYTIISGNKDAVSKLVAALDTRNRGASVTQLETSSTLSVLDFNGVVVQQRAYGEVASVIDALTLLSNMR